jgi:hypothetical protein
MKAIEEAIRTERYSILRCNQKVFDVLASDYLRLMNDVADDKEKIGVLADKLWNHIKHMRRSDISGLPVPLERMPGESDEVYGKRIYDAGGFLAANDAPSLKQPTNERKGIKP